MLTIALFKYQGPVGYTHAHVNAVLRMIKKHVTVSHQVVCFSDSPVGINCDVLPLETVDVHVPVSQGRNNFCKLQAFRLPGRVALLDLDVVIMDNIDPFFEFEDFVILEGTKAKRGDGFLSRYNSSFWCGQDMGYLWYDFTPDKARTMLRDNPKVIGSDQAWISQEVPDARTVGPEDGVYQFKRMVGNPDGVKMVFFAGNSKPWHPASVHRYSRVYKSYMVADG